ncbi:MAG: hypothetical protein ABI273_17635 [Lacunisphaera sp.]
MHFWFAGNDYASFSLEAFILNLFPGEKQAIQTHEAALTTLV